MKNKINITPSPRVLRMLGQIEFQPWQCMAELIDNSIDAFLSSRAAGKPIDSPRININMSNDKVMRSGSGEIIIVDNGPGMTLDELERALRAGYSGNDPVDKMGLFGMGFNIATARLANRTEVWTCTSDDENWTVATVDFRELERVNSFEIPVSQEPKSENEVYNNIHGTKIKLINVDSGRIGPLTRGVGKKNTRDKLGRVYGRIMKDLAVTIIYDGDSIKPWQHCVWSKDRSVPNLKFGQVPAVIEIDEELSEKQFCKTCWVWLNQSDRECHVCGNSENVISRKRRIKGWVGIQRYFDQKSYGIDYFRNGRLIESQDKSLFNYVDEYGAESLEYPIDTQHWGGRIVGELEIDFVRVSHQKDSFDKSDPEWKSVIHRVRGESPFQPEKAKSMGFEINESPLGRLFAGYRSGRESGLKRLVPGNREGKGLNSGPVIEYVKEFYKGVAEYQSDDKWFELVEQAEKAKRGGGVRLNKETTGDLQELLGNKVETIPNDVKSNINSEYVAVSELIQNGKSVGVEDSELSGNYSLDVNGIEVEIEAEVYRVPELNEDYGYKVQLSGKKMLCHYCDTHEDFSDSLISYQDIFLLDLATQLMKISGGYDQYKPASFFERMLRDKYFKNSSKSISHFITQGDELISDLVKRLDKALLDSDIKFSTFVNDYEREQLLRKCETVNAGKKVEITTFVEQNGLFSFLSRESVSELSLRAPDLYLRDDVLCVNYNDLSDREKELQTYVIYSMLRDCVWLIEDCFNSMNKGIDWRFRVKRAVSSVEYLNHLLIG